VPNERGKSFERSKTHHNFRGGNEE